MDRDKPIPSEQFIYIDELTLPTFFKLFRIPGLTIVTVLDEIKPKQKIWQKLLRMKGIDVIEAVFFTGELKTEDGEAVYLAARRLSGQIALVAARDIIQSEIFLCRLNKKYDRNTMQLFIARQLHLYIEFWAVRIWVAQTLCVDIKRTVVWLREPVLFNSNLLNDAFPNIDLQFYSVTNFWRAKLVATWILGVARDMKLIFGFGARAKKPADLETKKPSVLMLQEDNIRADHSLRGQPHWLGAANDFFDAYIVELKSSKFSIVDDTLKLKQLGVTVIPTSTFRSAMRKVGANQILRNVRRDRYAAFWAAFRAEGFSRKFFLLQVKALLRQAELMGALALWLNARVFLVRETQHPFADAMQLVSSDLQITTVAYQYSNMGFLSPIMMTTADQLLIFSDMYKKIYQSDGIAPKSIVSIGYLYDDLAGRVLKKARAHREMMAKAGADFIVCYFDESVQTNRWGLVSKSEHLGELHVLASAVLADPTFGVIVKSQFMRNSPSQLYPNDQIIQAAKSTGRYFELMAGVHRNDIYPAEAALAADLCIGHKFGATAALEAALLGVRTVLLDPYGTKTLWDFLYNAAGIEYAAISLLMETIVRHRSGDVACQNLGDWASILPYFDSHQDNRASGRLYEIIEEDIRMSF